MCDLLTDPYIEQLRSMRVQVEAQLAWLDTLNPPSSAEADPCADAVVGGTFEGVK